MTVRSSDDPQPSLENLLDLNEPVADWSDGDLAAMLRHQLSQPLEPCGLSLRELLERPDASAESLMTVKRHAKIRRAQNDRAVPQDLWRVVYFAAIAAALRGGQRITDLSPEETRQGLTWSLSRPWLDPAIRQLIEQARSTLAQAAAQIHAKPHP